MTRRNSPLKVDQVEAFKRYVETTVTLAATGNYDANDVMSNDADADEGDAQEIEIGHGIGDIINIVQIIAHCSEDSVLNRLRLHFFNAAPLAAEVEMDDQATFAIVTAAGDAKYIGSIDLTAFRDVGAVAVSETDQILKRLALDPASSKIYMVIQTLDAETNETAGMTIKFGIYLE